ncbi:MAG: DUF4282 domain-containing protein [Betaproteobacteria bacterium]|nr:DUF4282 domain-containing protein [Betaproteobacteria bacterium]
MKALLTFDTMLAPKLITLLYYLGLIGVLIGGIGSIATGRIIPGILTLVVGGLLVRVSCEIWIIFFKMNETLQEIRNK